MDDLGNRPLNIYFVDIVPNEGVTSTTSSIDCEPSKPKQSHPSRLSSASTSEFAEEEKLGHGFTPADELEAVDIGPGDRPRPTYVSKKLNPDFKNTPIVSHGSITRCLVWIDQLWSINYLSSLVTVRTLSLLGRLMQRY